MNQPQQNGCSVVSYRSVFYYTKQNISVQRSSRR